MLLHSANTLVTPSGNRIGPNALIQTINALREFYIESQIASMLRQSNQDYLLHQSPQEMIEEGEFDRLALNLCDHIGVMPTRKVLQRSGELTADYLLAHRIPKPFQELLKVLPRQLALRLLFMSMSQNAWTFIGSGEFTYDMSGHMPVVKITSDFASMEAACGFFGGTFEHLIRKLIDTRVSVRYILELDQKYCQYVIHYS